MKRTITESQFIHLFDEYNRGNNFSYEGRRALFNALEEIEDPESEQEVDIIALCCEFTEYEDVEDYLKNYSTDLELSDYDGDKEDFEEAVKEEIQQKTWFIPVGSEGFILQDH